MRQHNRQVNDPLHHVLQGEVSPGHDPGQRNCTCCEEESGCKGDCQGEPHTSYYRRIGGGATHLAERGVEKHPCQRRYDEKEHQRSQYGEDPVEESVPFHRVFYLSAPAARNFLSDAGTASGSSATAGESGSCPHSLNILLPSSLSMKSKNFIASSFSGALSITVPE